MSLSTFLNAAFDLQCLREPTETQFRAILIIVSRAAIYFAVLQPPAPLTDMQKLTDAREIYIIL